MAQIYSYPEREADPHALPNIEIFHLSASEIIFAGTQADWPDGGGWYYWPCFPGCLPDGDAIGPFETEDEAKADAVG